MKIPNNVRIGPITYEIYSDNKEQFSDRGSDGAYGETLHKEQKIVLSPENKLDQMKLTLIHEIFHCVLEQSSLMLSSDEEEKFVRAISPVLDVLQQNPQVTQYLVGNEHAEIHGSARTNN